jgi:hypothetical protein
MNKPKFEARGKKHNRGQAPTPDQELKDMLSQTQPPISEGLGISQEALDTEGFSTAEVAERHYGIATPEAQEAPATITQEAADEIFARHELGSVSSSPESNVLIASHAQAPFPGSDREWTAEEKAGMNDALRQYGWKDQSPPLAATAEDVAALAVKDNGANQPTEVNEITIVNAAPGFKLGGQPLVVQQAQPVNDAEEDPPTYYQEDLIIVIMRHRAKDPDEDRTRMRRMLSAFVDRISGLNTGFKVIPAPGSNPAKLAKPQYEAASSTVKLDYTERKGKIFAKFFENWGVDISRFGLNDNTTIDFFVIEPSKDGKTVLDAWNCTGMHPYYMGTVEADTYYGHKQLRQVTKFQVTLNGNVRRGTVEIEAAQGLLDDLNAQLAAGA